MNLLLLIVILFVLISVIMGFRRGFVRSLALLCSSIAAILVTMLLLNVVTDWVCANTEIEADVARRVQTRVMEMLPEELSAKTGELPMLQQAAIIEAAPVPQVLKNRLTENNNKSMYELLGVSDFVDYLAHYIARFLVRVMCFFLLFLVTSLIIRLIFRGLNNMAQLPLLQGLNRLLGGGVGLARALLVIWVVFLLITPLCAAGPGQAIGAQIENSALLSSLYNKNVLLTIVSDFH